MTEQQDLVALARAIVDANSYLTLATVDEGGSPWPTPVYYAVEGYREFFWVSRPEARHSRNLAARPDAAFVIFDSRVPLGTGQAVYASAIVDEPAGDELECGIEVFSHRSLAQGGRAWTRADVVPPAHLRLYRATAKEHFVLDADDRRIPVDPSRAL